MKMSEKMQENIKRQSERASRIYHACYDNTAYMKAVHGRSVTYANALLDEAMAVCGHPRFVLSFRNWSPNAIAFLERFDSREIARKVFSHR